MHFERAAVDTSIGRNQIWSLSQMQKEAQQISGKFPKIKKWSLRLVSLLFFHVQNVLRRDGIELGVPGILEGIFIFPVQDEG